MRGFCIGFGYMTAVGDVVRHVLAVDLLLGPQPVQDLEILVHELAALVERNAERVELALVPARRHAHDQAAVRELVHAGELLGERDRIAQRQHQDAGAELDALGARGDRGQQRSANR